MGRAAWRGRDTRLERSVAIKILSAEFAANEQFRVRFEREAKTISQLNHPNICTLFDVGHDSGRDFLVMELLEGETLAERLLRGPIPLHEVLRYGLQIAEALDKAHRQGVVHRDLKPGNIMLTKSGAKLLDFGLAKSFLRGAPAPSPAQTNHATELKPLTQEGTILGTFQYMAPELLEGADADARTDIFAFGAVLYEMATGCRAFQGKTRTSLIAAMGRRGKKDHLRQWTKDHERLLRQRIGRRQRSCFACRDESRHRGLRGGAGRTDAHGIGDGKQRHHLKSGHRQLDAADQEVSC